MLFMDFPLAGYGILPFMSDISPPPNFCSRFRHITMALGPSYVRARSLAHCPARQHLAGLSPVRFPATSPRPTLFTYCPHLSGEPHLRTTA